MPLGRLTCLIAGIALVAATSRAGEPPWVGSESTRTRLTVIGLDGSAKKVLLDSPHRLAAPEWSPDGKTLVVNGGGTLWRVPAAGGTPRHPPRPSSWRPPRPPLARERRQAVADLIISISERVGQGGVR